MAEDSRATQHPGNVVYEPGGRDDCPTLWPGSFGVILDAEVDRTNTYIDITELPDDIEIVGVIVKGGNRYNKYDAANLGDLPWLDLRSPNNASGGPAQISHWFACAVDTDQPTTTTTTATPTSSSATTTTPSQPTTTTSGSQPTTTSGPSTSPTTSGSSTSPTTTGSSSVTTTAPATTTTKVAPVVVDDDDLPLTGASIGWMLLIGLLLLTGGVVAVTSPQIRAALLRR